jgi:hypothetical protein
MLGSSTHPQPVPVRDRVPGELSLADNWFNGVDLLKTGVKG